MIGESTTVAKDSLSRVIYNSAHTSDVCSADTKEYRFDIVLRKRGFIPYVLQDILCLKMSYIRVFL
jgi:hypothetical protein